MSKDWSETFLLCTSDIRPSFFEASAVGSHSTYSHLTHDFTKVHVCQKELSVSMPNSVPFCRIIVCCIMWGETLKMNYHRPSVDEWIDAFHLLTHSCVCFSNSTFFIFCMLIFLRRGNIPGYTGCVLWNNPWRAHQTNHAPWHATTARVHRWAITGQELKHRIHNSFVFLITFQKWMLATTLFSRLLILFIKPA